MMYNVVLNIKAIDQTLVSDHSNENKYFQAELFTMLYTVVAAFKAVVQTLECEQPNEGC